MSKRYDAADIEVLSGLEPVRRRPGTVVLPVLWTPTRSERMSAEREFGRVLQMPSMLEDFLTTIDKAGRVR